VVLWSSGCGCEGCGRGGAPPHLFLTFFFSFATSLMFTSEERSACKKRVSGPGLAKPRSGRWLRTRAASVRYRGAPAAQHESLAAAVAAATWRSCNGCTAAALMHPLIQRDAFAAAEAHGKTMHCTGKVGRGVWGKAAAAPRRSPST
jgi:hypothetical protein